MIGQTISHYKILEELGAGGMGVVYKARDTKLKRLVALKFLSSQALGTREEKTRFVREAQAAAALDHPNICTVHEIDEVDGRTFIVMAYIAGRSLREKIASGPLDVEEALRVAIDAAQGLQESHEKGIVHRDIKSSNIMLTEKGQAKITDFGLAMLSGQTRVTKTGTAVGTLVYMSPEQAGGDVDHRTDIWALGVVLYEMLTGRLPFQADHEQAVAYQILHEEPKPITGLRTGIPLELERIVNKCLQKKPSDRYQHADELVVDLRKEKKTPAITPWRKVLQFALPVVGIVTAVIVLLVLDPFGVQKGQDQKAVAAENSLAIMYFENLANEEDPRRLGSIITNLLITDLSESEYVSVVSRQRLYDILKSRGKEGERVLDNTTATGVARQAGARWMLMGSVLQVEPTFVVTAQLIDVQSGDVAASQRVTGHRGEKIFTLVDKLTREVKDDLDLPAAARKEWDPSVAAVTTQSTEAYRHYIEGWEIFMAGGDSNASAAKRSFQKALEYDSTFAEAYLVQASYLMPGTGKEKRDLIAKAGRFSEGMSTKGKRLIEVRRLELSGDVSGSIRELEKFIEEFPDEKVAYFRLGRVTWDHSYAFESPGVASAGAEKAIHYYRKGIEIDPLNAGAYNQLAYIYGDIGKSDSSLWAINKAIELATEKTASGFYDTRGDLYGQAGRVDLAIESYQEALARGGRYLSEMKLGQMHLYQREYDEAEASFQKLLALSGTGERSMGRYLMALVPLHQGKMEEALHVLGQGVSGDELEGYEGPAYLVKLFSRSSVYAEIGQLDRAIAEIEKLVALYEEANPHDPARWRDNYIYLLIKNKDLTRAEEVLAAVKSRIVDPTDVGQTHRYWLGKGWMDLARGEVSAAITDFEESAKWEKGIRLRYPLAMAYLQAGHLAEAVGEFEGLLERYTPYRAYYMIWVAKARFYLGTAYEKSGWNSKAIEQYEEFLDLWKDADPGIEHVADAKRRLAVLKDA